MMSYGSVRIFDIVSFRLWPYCIRRLWQEWWWRPSKDTHTHTHTHFWIPNLELPELLRDATQIWQGHEDGEKEAERKAIVLSSSDRLADKTHVKNVDFVVCLTFRFWTRCWKETWRVYSHASSSAWLPPVRNRPTRQTENKVQLKVMGFLKPVGPKLKYSLLTTPGQTPQLFFFFRKHLPAPD